MNKNWRQIDIRIYAVLASLLISVFTILVPQSPNDDAYVYLRTAEIFSVDGFSAALQHYSWAGYSILIALFGFLGVSLFTAAYIVNALFFALLVFAFISIVKEIDDSESSLLLAAVTILVYPELNEYRYFIIRDIGFWAFAIFALWQFLLYMQQATTKFGLGFCCSLLLATMLRMESIAYLIITPFALLLDYRFEMRERGKRFLKLYEIIGATMIVGGILLTLLGLNTWQLFVEFLSVYKPFLQTLFSTDTAQNYELGIALFNEHAATYSQEYIVLFMMAGLSAILIANVASGIGGPFLVVLIIGFLRGKLRLQRQIALPIIFYVVVNLVILFAFIFVTRYLSGRYTILMCILFALFIPIFFSQLLGKATTDKYKYVNIFVALFVTYCAIDSFYSFGSSKDYIDDAVDWIVLQKESPGALLTNNHALAYNSGKIENYDRTQYNLTESEILNTEPGDLIAVELRYEMEQLLARDNIADIIDFEIAFSDSDRQRIVVYRRRQDSPR